tara:strand:- start:2542 stop:3165 length:624 start_codon:yes stop_codon:yes gene_type:complete
MSHERNLTYLNNRRLIYRRLPTTDKPDIDTKEFMYYKDGTHQCYELFRSSAKITTYRSLKWHLLVLWYLNPSLNTDEFFDLAEYIAEKRHGFVSFNVSAQLLDKVIYEVNMSDLERPPNNKLRKVIFKPFSGLTKEQKLSIVGQLVGQSPRIQPDDIYAVMVDMHDNKQKITIRKLSELLKVSSRTVHRHMCQDLKKEKELLNQQLC